MAKQEINVGTIANDGTGDTIRGAMNKVNSNFTELYTNLSNTNSVGFVYSNGTDLYSSTGFEYDQNLNRLRFDSNGTTGAFSTFTLSDTNGSSIYLVEFSDSDAYYPGITLAKRRGSQASQLKSLPGDTLGKYSVDGGTFGSTFHVGSISWTATDPTSDSEIDSTVAISAKVGNSSLVVLSSDVDGKIVISGSYTLPNVDGTDGQTLVTDGSGNVSWDTMVSLSVLKSVVADSADFADFQARIAAL